MLRSSKFLLLGCFASLCLACSTLPVPTNDGAGGDSGGATIDGAQPDGDAAVAEGGQTDAEVDGAVDGHVVAEDGHVEDVRSEDAPIDGAKPDGAKADGALEVAPDRPPAKLPNGGQCAGDSACQSGSCVTGVCCATACNNGCSACVMAKTGKADGMCAPDKSLDKMQCGTACSTLAMGVAGVVQKVCDSGNCVASPLLKIVEICQVDDKCTTSFCDQPDPNTARCVNAVCPQQGTCCCGAQGGARMCTQKTACSGDRSCM
jgi:hypothetical protein